MRRGDRRAKDTLVKKQVQSPGLSDEAIGKRLGVTRQAVFQLRLRAMEKIKRAFLADPECMQMVADIMGAE